MVFAWQYNKNGVVNLVSFYLLFFYKEDKKTERSAFCNPFALKLWNGICSVADIFLQIWCCLGGKTDAVTTL